jgi:hypothetical protein
MEERQCAIAGTLTFTHLTGAMPGAQTQADAKKHMKGAHLRNRLVSTAKSLCNRTIILSQL